MVAVVRGENVEVSGNTIKGPCKFRVYLTGSNEPLTGSKQRSE